MRNQSSLKRLVVSICAACAFLATVSPGKLVLAQPLDEGGEHDHLGCGKARALAQRYLADQLREEERQRYQAMREAGLREAYEDTDLLHCDVEIEVLPGQTENLIGSNTMTIQSKSSSLTQFTFRLRSQFSIDNAVVNGSTPVTVSTPSTTTRVVTLDRTYGTDEIFTLTIEYSGHAESPGFGSIEFTTHSGADIVYTLSEPYYSYTWWPVKDGDFGEPGDNSEKFTLDLAVIAPDDMVTASNGLLQGVDIFSGNRLRYRWSSDYPIPPYLVCFSSTNYNTWSVNYTPAAGGTMPVWFYIYPEHDNSSNRSAWEKVVQMMVTLRPFYGEYPFVDEKYGIYECNFGGGMEHQTFTAQGTFNEGVTVHELGRQWWGDLVTCKTWHDIWLNEGFARYTEALWEEHKPGSSGLPALKAKMATFKYTGGGSVYVTTAELGSLYDIFDGDTTYDKAGWVVHMLRHVLGDDSFFAMLAAYRAAYEFSAADTEDFRAVAEQFYPGGDLNWFFQEWVYGEYLPTYSWGWDHVQVNGQDYLLVYVDQTQSASYQRFTMPIDIVVDGSTHVIFNDADPEHFVIPLDAAPSSVAFDPDAWILWTTRTSTSYVPGPPKIVETSPAPGQIVEQVDTDAVEITFHTNVSTSAGHYSLVGATTGPVGVGFAYDSGTNTVTLSTGGDLPPDEYTLTVSDALTAVNSGDQLDGEIADPADPASLPSGEGLEGGSAVVEFVVICVFGDADCDDNVDLADFSHFQNCFTGQDAGPAQSGCEMMRFDPDTDVDTDDFAEFSNVFAGP
jgi:hypothetical protein